MPPYTATRSRIPMRPCPSPSRAADPPAPSSRTSSSVVARYEELVVQELAASGPGPRRHHRSPRMAQPCLSGNNDALGLKQGPIQDGWRYEAARREWTLYRELRATDVPRMPTFGDYVVQGSSRPAKGFRPVPNLRYTADDHTVVLRGNQKASNETQYAAICGRAVKSPEFRGGRFSPGDASLRRAQRGNLVLRDQEAMRSAGTAHHIRLVTTVLQTMT